MAKYEKQTKNDERVITLVKFMTLGYPDTAVSLDLAVRLFL